jgi:hypothetical protein
LLAADPKSATVYTSILEKGGGKVVAFRWRGGGFVRLPSLDGIIHPTGARRPLAVIYPAAERLHFYLVVGTQRSSDLIILQLPECRVVHRHNLPGVRVMGLSANFTPAQRLGLRAISPTKRAASTAGSFFGEGSEAYSSDFGGLSGQVLYVLDGVSRDVLVFRWPLSGMPLLD